MGFEANIYVFFFFLQSQYINAIIIIIIKAIFSIIICVYI